MPTLVHATFPGRGVQSLSEELKAAGEGENLLSPFVNKVYDASNAALFYAHNGRLDFAQERLQGTCRYAIDS